MSRKTQRAIELVVEALDDVPIDEDLAKEEVTKLGADVPAFAARLRQMVTDADAADVKARIDDARAAYAAEVERLERRRIDGGASRESRLATFRTLLAKVPPEAVAMHFHKYETVTDEELDELIRAVRHLLGEDEDE